MAGFRNPPPQIPGFRRLVDALLDARRSAGSGVRIGFEDVDALTGTIPPGSLVVIAGAPGSGKTQLLLSAGVSIAFRQGKNAVVHSYESSIDALEPRVRSIAGIYEQRHQERGSIYGVTSAVWSFDEAIPLLRDFDHQYGVDAVLLDHCELLRDMGHKGVAVAEVRDALDHLRSAARSLKCVIVVTSPLAHRQTALGRYPTIDDLPFDGLSAQYADVVVLVHDMEPRFSFVGRADDDPFVFDTRSSLKFLDVAKNRFGPTGSTVAFLDQHRGGLRDLRHGATA